jgi:hypothetical protein
MSESGSGPLLKEKIPLSQSAAWSAQIRAMQAGDASGDWLDPAAKSEANNPDLIKTYPVRENLPVR